MPFKKGHSGNPGGRPKAEVAVRELARQNTEKAIATLVKALDAKSEAVRVRAAEALLDRGWGRAPQAIEHSGEAPFTGIEVVLVDTGVRRNSHPADGFRECPEGGAEDKPAY